LALGLLGWNVWQAQRWGSRPTELDVNAAAGRIDLNHADHAQLLQLPGVGEHTAERIEEYRLSHNGFHNVDELRQVHGVGPATLARLRPYIDADAEDVLEDGMDAVPPRKGDALKGVKPAARQAVTGTKKGDALKEPIDVNHATATELQRLPGVGPAMSSRILLVREQRPFRSVEELRRVPGIGAKTLEKLRPFVKVDEEDRQ
jgi:competence protein ComEA